MRLRRPHSYPGVCPAGRTMQAAQAPPEALIGFSTVHAAACRQERRSQATTLPDSGTRRQAERTLQQAQPGPGTQPHAPPVAEHRPDGSHAAWHDQGPGSALSGNDLQLAPELPADQAAEAAGEADLEVVHRITEQGTEAEMQELHESALEDCFGGSRAPYSAAGMLHATMQVTAQERQNVQHHGSQAPDTAAAAHAAGQARLWLQQRRQVPPTASQPKWAQPGISTAAAARGDRQARRAEPEGQSLGWVPPTDRKPQWAQPGMCTVAAAAGDRHAWQAEPGAKSPGLLDLQSDRDISCGEQASTNRQARDLMGRACQVAQQGRAQLQGAAGTPAGTLQETVPDSPTVTLSPVLGTSLTSHEHLSTSEGCHHRPQQQQQPALVSASPSPAGLAEPPPPPANWLHMDEDSRNGGSMSVTPEHIAFQLGQQPDTAPAQVRTA